VQIAGVDEASPIKFDGTHLLSLREPYRYYGLPEGILVEDAENRPQVQNIHRDVLLGNAETNPELHFTPDDGYQYQGLLRSEGYAALVGFKSAWYPFTRTDALSSAFYCYDCGQQSPEVIIYTWQYQQDGIALPPQVQETHIDGSFNNVRLIGNKLYLVSQYSPSIEELVYYPTTTEEFETNQRIIDDLDLNDLSPTITSNNQSEPLITSDCHYPDENADIRLNPQVVSLTQIDISAPEDWTSSCVVGDISGAFFSRENVYLSRWDWEGNETEILKFSTSEEEGIEYQASGSVNGSLSYDSYYFGEVDGQLVYVNTLYDNELWWDFDGRHQLTVFEQNGDSLDIAAQIPNETAPAPIGKPGEQIYAVRIIDERAYIVTFDKVDPLYVIDLSEPNAPEILGELEIPGFSSYIHPINDDLLIGVGKNAETYEGITWFQGLNIRLFDVSDPSQPIALQSLDYGLRGSDTPVTYDPHSFTFAFDEENERFRFVLPMRLHGSEESYDPEAHPNTYYDWEETGLYQFEVATGANPSITEAARFLYDEELSYAWDAHPVIDNDNIYLVRQQNIDVIEWGSSEVTRSIDTSD
jgi:hypothetical protein